MTTQQHYTNTNQEMGDALRNINSSSNCPLSFLCVSHATTFFHVTRVSKFYMKVHQRIYRASILNFCVRVCVCVENSFSFPILKQTHLVFYQLIIFMKILQMHQFKHSVSYASEIS
jgi:hypothetical protein